MSRQGFMVAAALLTAVFFPVAGCSVSELEHDMAAGSIAPNAVEFFRPSNADIGDQLLDLLAQSSANIRGATISPVAGELDNGLDFETLTAELSFEVTEISVSMENGVLQASLTLDISDPVLVLEIFEGSTMIEDCDLHISVPTQYLLVEMVALQQRETGALELGLNGEPVLEGETTSSALDPYCPAQQFADLVDEAVVGEVQNVIYSAALEFVDVLLPLVEDFTGMETEFTGTLRSLNVPAGEVGKVHMSLLPSSDGEVFFPQGTRLDVAGGFQSSRASCVPSGVADLPAVETPAAQFAESVPVTGEDYLFAVSVADDFLLQGLVVAYRGGAFCRHFGAGDLEQIDVCELFPSLKALGNLGAARVALWPAGQPELEFEAPDPVEGEILPRLAVTLPRLSFDLYADLEGTDIRLVGMTADVTMELVPVLDGGELSFRYAETHVSELAIGFSELLLEVAGGLRSACEKAIDEIGREVIGELDPLFIPWPKGVGRLLGAKRKEGRTTLYFGP